MLLVGVGLKSSGDPGRDFSCWEIVLQGLLVGLDKGGDGWSGGGGGVRGRDMWWRWVGGGAKQLGGGAMVIIF